VAHTQSRLAHVHEVECETVEHLRQPSPRRRSCIDCCLPVATSSAPRADYLILGAAADACSAGAGSCRRTSRRLARTTRRRTTPRMRCGMRCPAATSHRLAPRGSRRSQRGRGGRLSRSSEERRLAALSRLRESVGLVVPTGASLPVDPKDWLAMLAPRFGRRGVSAARRGAGNRCRKSTHAENEALRQCGSYSATGANIDNAESSGVVARDARSHVRVRHPRHAWVDAVIVDDPTGQPWPAGSGKAR
jgi:hypothetical protein